MGKNNSLGRSLIKDRFGNKNKRLNSESFLHTSELKDGYDWNKLNLQSVTEENSFNEFLSTAELADAEFKAEKLNITVINPRSAVGVLSKEETKNIQESQRKNKHIIKIPRRPKWNTNTTTEELLLKEKEGFLEWRRNLALFQEETGLLLTPYEKNLDFWRQLWRVVEKSDVLVQIVDARNPLLYRCEDLESYVKEVDGNKQNLILCNKADFLTHQQRCTWAKYFDSINTSVAFFSALQLANNDENKLENEHQHITDLNSEVKESNSDLNSDDEYETEEEEEIIGIEAETQTYYYQNSPKILDKQELIEFLRNFARQKSINLINEVIVIGLVGYPNVGKSSTINAVLPNKKVSVSATPGKTKHFQTVYLEKNLLLCDCPGLVMPSFVVTKADMIINGILPIDQMKDHVSPINLICTRIPRHVLEAKYGIMIPKPDEEEDPNRPPSSEELLNAYAYNRGFMTANGQPDNARASRYILKDYVSGKLLYCYAPSNVSQKDFCKFEVTERIIKVPESTLKAIKPFKVTTRDLQYSAFQDQSFPNAHIKRPTKYDNNGVLKTETNNNENSSKPWKNHKEKRNKHEKLRIKYRYLDE